MFEISIRLLEKKLVDESIESLKKSLFFVLVCVLLFF